MASSLNAWLKSQGYWKQYGKTVGDSSHLFLDGGIACVPEDMTATFNNVYAASLFRGEVTFVVEKKTPTFRMFLDLDMRSRNPVTADAVLLLTRLVARTVIDFFRLPEDRARTIVCLSEPSWTPTTGWKTGAHVSWPETATTTIGALRCRDAVIAALRASTFAAWFSNSIEAVVDKSVLDKNGMRMIGAHKLGPCPDCAAGSCCATCGGRGKAAQPGVYWPRFDLRNADADATILAERPTTMTDLRAWISATSLRVRRAGPLDSPSAAAVDDEADEELLLETSYNGRLVRESVRAHADHLEAFVASLPKGFAGARVTALHRVEDEDVVLARTDSNYCLNIGRKHRTNNVYFLISERGAYQMCFCRCETLDGRKNGLCRDFHSKLFRVDPDFRRELFGTAAGDDLVKPAKPLRAVVDAEYEKLMKYYMKT